MAREVRCTLFLGMSEFSNSWSELLPEVCDGTSGAGISAQNAFPRPRALSYDSAQLEQTNYASFANAMFALRRPFRYFAQRRKQESHRLPLTHSHILPERDDLL